MDFGQISFQLICGLSSIGHHRTTSKHNIADGSRKKRTVLLGSMMHISCHYIYIYISCFWSVIKPASFVSPRKVQVRKGCLEGGLLWLPAHSRASFRVQITPVYLENVKEAFGIIS